MKHPGPDTDQSPAGRDDRRYPQGDHDAARGEDAPGGAVPAQREETEARTDEHVEEVAVRIRLAEGRERPRLRIVGPRDRIEAAACRPAYTAVSTNAPSEVPPTTAQSRGVRIAMATLTYRSATSARKPRPRKRGKSPKTASCPLSAPAALATLAASRPMTARWIGERGIMGGPVSQEQSGDGARPEPRHRTTEDRLRRSDDWIAHGSMTSSSPAILSAITHASPTRRGERTSSLRRGRSRLSRSPVKGRALRPARYGMSLHATRYRCPHPARCWAR